MIVGLTFLGMGVGAAAGIAALMLGVSFWLALMLYLGVGGFWMVGAAAIMLLRAVLNDAKEAGPATLRHSS